MHPAPPPQAEPWTPPRLNATPSLTSLLLQPQPQSHRLFIFHSAPTSQGGDPCPQVDWGPDTAPVQSPGPSLCVSVAWTLLLCFARTPLQSNLCIS